MAASGYTPISLYYSSTAAATPTAGNLVNGELAINITDGKLYYKDNTGTVKVIAGTGGTGVVAGSNTQVQYNNNGVFGASSNFTFDGTNIGLAGGTANGVAYLNGSKVLTTGSALTFNGTSLNLTGDVGFLSGSPAYWYNPAGNAYSYIKLDSSNVLQLFNNANSATAFSIGGSEQMRLTSTGLGIGTSSPGAKLDVTVNTASTTYAQVWNVYNGATFQFTNTLGGDSTNGVYFGPFQSVPLRFITNNTERMRLDTSGNLGLGVTPSAWTTYKALQIGECALSAGGTDIEIVSNAYYNSGWKYRSTSGGATKYSQQENAYGAHAWYTAPSGTAGNAITFTQAMTLDASGNLLTGGLTSYPGQADPNATANGAVALNTKRELRWSNTNASIYGGSGGGDDNLYYHSGLSHIWRVSNTERMRIDSSGNVGIGTSSPLAKLDVNGSGLFRGDGTEGGEIVVRNPDNSSTGLIIDVAGADLGRVFSVRNNSQIQLGQLSGTGGIVTLYTQGSERMRVAASGNVGIGTNNPAFKLQVTGGIYSIDASAEASVGAAGLNMAASYLYSNATAWGLYSTRGGGIINYIDASGTTTLGATSIMTFSANGAERMRIDSSGNLAMNGGYILTQSTSQSLALFANPTVVDNTPRIEVNGTTAPSPSTVFLRGNTIIFTKNAAGSESARIDSNGSLLVGMTSTTSSANKVSVAQASYSTLLATASTSPFYAPVLGVPTGSASYIPLVGHATVLNATGYVQHVWFGSYRSGTATWDSACIAVGGSDAGPTVAYLFSYAGAAYQPNNSSTWSTVSDARIKTNVRPISGALDKVCSLSGKHFEFKGKEGKTKTGFIAQEFEQTFPGHVHEQAIPEEYKQYVTDSDTIKTVDADLVPYLVEAIKELKLELDATKAELAALKGA